MNHEEKLKIIGREAAVLLSLHLENPEEWNPLKITEKLFERFEELELEGEVNGN